MRTQEEFREFEQWLHDSPGHRHATAVGFGALGDEVDQGRLKGTNVHKRMTRGRFVLQDDRLVFVPWRRHIKAIWRLGIIGIAALIFVGGTAELKTGRTPTLFILSAFMIGYFAIQKLYERTFNSSNTSTFIRAARKAAAFSLPLERIESIAVDREDHARISILRIAISSGEGEQRAALFASRTKGSDRELVDFDTQHFADLIRAVIDIPKRVVD